MEIIKNLDQGIYNLMLRGTFTFADHPAFRDILLKIEEKDVKQVVFHMEHVEFIDSAALGMLLLAHDEAEKHHKQLIISSPSGQVKKMFSMARFNTLFEMS